MTTESDSAIMLSAAAIELETVFRIQGEQLTETREQLAETNKRFNEMMESARADLKPGAPVPKELFGNRPNPYIARKRLVESNELSLRWERGFCDVYDSLIGLAGHPGHTEQISRISKIVRDLRLLQMEGRLTGNEDDVPPIITDLPQFVPDENTINDFKFSMMEQVSKWSEAWMAKSKQKYNESIQRTGLLIQDLVKEADALNESLSTKQTS